MSVTDRSEISAANVEFVREGVRETAEAFPARIATSEDEKLAAECFAEKLSQRAEVSTEEFVAAPDAANGWIYVSATLAVLAFAAYFFVSFVSVVLLLLAVVPAVVQGVMCSRAFDKMYKDGTSRNVIAVRGCSGERKRRIILTAHVDSAPVNRLKTVFGGKIAVAVCAVSPVGLVYLFALNVARWAYLGSLGTGLANGAYLIAGIVGIVFVPFWIACMFMINKSKVSAGACDDLSGCWVLLGLLKSLDDGGVVLKNTEITVVLTGAEECGLRGAKAWCDAHKTDYSAAETSVIAVDNVGEKGGLVLETAHLNGLLKGDAKLAETFAQVARNAGIACKERRFSAGATDAAAFAQAGYGAVCLTSSSGFATDRSHAPDDNADAVDAGVVADSLTLLLSVLEKLDEE